MDTAHDLVGRTLQDRFTITDLLGEGAMGAVYRGVDGVELRDVAIKVLHPELGAMPDAVTRFYREGTAARRADHANSVRFLGRGVDQGLHFLVMELLEGRCLADVLHEERRLGQARAARLVAEVCSALGAAHERGVVHRDLKPENIMVIGRAGDPLGEQVKLLDFGIAKNTPGLRAVEDSWSTEDLTACGSIVGTPEYMAPEQCRGLAVDPRADLYACGAVLYRLITGRVPFTAEHPLEICQLHITEPPTPPGQLVPGLHPELEAVILRALSKAPEERQPSAAALREELLRALDRLTEGEQEITATRPTEALVSAELCAAASVDLGTGGAPEPPPPEGADAEALGAGALVEVPAAAARPRPLLAPSFWAAFAAGMLSTAATLALLWAR